RGARRVRRRDGAALPALDPRARRQPRRDGGVRRVPRPQTRDRAVAQADGTGCLAMLVATWNVNSLRVRMPHLRDWLVANPVDVIALQETKLDDPAFPREEIESLGLKVAFHGQRTYNGVALLATHELEDVVPGIPGFADEQKRVL